VGWKKGRVWGKNKKRGTRLKGKKQTGEKGPRSGSSTGSRVRRYRGEGRGGLEESRAGEENKTESISPYSETHTGKSYEGGQKTNIKKKTPMRSSMKMNLNKRQTKGWKEI